MTTNVLSDAQAKIWSRNAQLKAKQNLVARLICSFREQKNLRDGQSVYRPALSRPTEGAVGADGSYTASATTATKQELAVDQWRYSAVYINEKDAAQISINFVKIQSTESGAVLGERLDRSILAEYVNADAYVAAETAVPTKDTIATIASAGQTKLRNLKCEKGMGWAWVVDPEIDALITLKYIDSGFNQADAKLVKGSLVYARPFLGMTVMISNGAMSWTGDLLMGTQPANGEKVTINGVVFTFTTAAPAAAGEVLRGASAATSRANLETLVNAPGTTTGTGFAVSADDQAALALVSAADDASTKVTITSTGGRIAMTHTMAAAGNGTSAMVLHTLMLKRGAIDLVFQKDFHTKEKEVSGKLGKDIVTSALYGYKTFDDGARCMCDVRVTTAVNDVN